MKKSYELESVCHSEEISGRTEVDGSRTNGLGRVGHGVERTEREGELVDDVVVGAVLLLDEHAERLQIGRAHV